MLLKPNILWLGLVNVSNQSADENRKHEFQEASVLVSEHTSRAMASYNRTTKVYFVDLNYIFTRRWGSFEQAKSRL